LVHYEVSIWLLPHVHSINKIRRNFSSNRRSGNIINFGKYEGSSDKAHQHITVVHVLSHYL
jgi:hypothetical protein